MFNRILVAVDGSPTSNKALVAALQLARESGGRVRLLHAFDDLVYLTGYEYSAELIQHCRGHGEKVVQDALEIPGRRRTHGREACGHPRPASW